MYIVISLNEATQESLALLHKCTVIQKKVSRCFDIKSTVAEQIISIFEIVFEFMFSKITEGHLESG